MLADPMIGCAGAGLLAMSALGQKPTSRQVQSMSALPPIADITEDRRHVRFVPKADILRCGKKRRYSITSSARTSSEGGMVIRTALAVLRLQIARVCTFQNLVDVNRQTAGNI